VCRPPKVVYQGGVCRPKCEVVWVTAIHPRNSKFGLRYPSSMGSCMNRGVVQGNGDGRDPVVLGPICDVTDRGVVRSVRHGMPGGRRSFCVLRLGRVAQDILQKCVLIIFSGSFVWKCA
jgi:hypothetical protein